MRTSRSAQFSSSGPAPMRRRPSSWRTGWIFGPSNQTQHGSPELPLPVTGAVTPIAFVGVALVGHRPGRARRPHVNGRVPPAMVAGTAVIAGTIVSGRMPGAVMMAVLLVLVAAGGIRGRHRDDQADRGCGEQKDACHGLVLVMVL